MGEEFSSRIACELQPPEFYYAVGQGALAVETRLGDEQTRGVLSQIADEKTSLETIAERAVMRRLEGGCHVPIGVSCEWKGEEELKVKCKVWTVDGERLCEAEKSVNVCSTDKKSGGLVVGTWCSDFVKGELVDGLGTEIAESMIEDGVKEILLMN